MDHLTQELLESAKNQEKALKQISISSNVIAVVLVLFCLVKGGLWLIAWSGNSIY